jgi:hypothetical protein
MGNAAATAAHHHTNNNSHEERNRPKPWQKKGASSSHNAPPLACLTPPVGQRNHLLKLTSVFQHIMIFFEPVSAERTSSHLHQKVQSIFILSSFFLSFFFFFFFWNLILSYLSLSLFSCSLRAATCCSFLSLSLLLYLCHT